ncbi:Clp protease ClpP [Clostridium tagluense]|uniref:head maturation protease, ClpP-related n=1 Tax=Clostridium tagluense TaxID=360422 RepID=UPI001CF53461|nr:head maturation protease, ClpP-related [Clostridium tagluense]MCB2311613.1 Clp protease ClpP [Clostridium tagluense]MCB2316337.1 Clp protease ClpP [Clostridium tagluense]MCB2321279.1 Clp protease ClpP [Clostridium tagluense]MCB2326206.1 Clp protease ClpP [Clostridium tagluense]MCB2331015.1 Clp protease ClpP [Clostridium tagluense]
MKTNFIIKQQVEDNSTMDLYIYDDVEGDSTSWMGEVIESETSANYIKGQLEKAGDVKNINIYINSYGGSVKEGLGIYNQLKRHSAYKTAYIDGFACSIASVIPMACDHIIMGSNALMMVHHASMGVFGNVEELKKATKDLEVIDIASCSSYLAKAGNKLTQETLTQLLDGQTWLNATDCVQYGLCDEILGVEDKAITIAKQRLNQSIKDQINLTQHEEVIEVPKELIVQKTNAEKLMMAFNNKLNTNK